MTPRAHRPGRRTAPAGLPPLSRVPVGGTGPEDVVVDREGHVITGVEDGRILRVRPYGRPVDVEQVAHTGGRPLGLEVLPDGRLLVCDAERGLLRVTPGRGNGAVEVLVDSVAGAPLRFCSNAAAAADGTVYFTVSSRRYGLQDWLGDLIEDTATGGLFRLRPGSDAAELLLDGLRFANGVVLSEDESCVVVAESGAYRLTRLWLSGARAGRQDTLIENLPGFPDNLSRGADGTIWVALAGPRQAPLDWLRQAPVGVRRAVWRIVRPLRVRPRPVARVMGVGPDGRARHDLGRRRVGYRMVTSVHACGSALVLGSLLEDGIAVCAAPVSEDVIS
ncbi:SMP-30/gluconolactonase/LRE family protein [Streptomyces sporangiiformans]|uniref:SMP-30/gluconolactonase/LRE family protein n=1 Tax=Streptomyces sporangiiformans TaxID=2315329 RepID=A0A505D1Z7_9ACTN|nr:SMP-30/gluconolactonase/LRE family protein [Streptomyces sporangiiformans]TPQ16807.1 SMP-30/gluconolactonase/LRE family protein [Streptomyces sporangiiformans]